MKRLLTSSFLTLNCSIALALALSLTTALTSTESALAQDCNKSVTIYGTELFSSGSVTFGREIYRAGDVDNDGYPDMLIVAPKDGRAIVYSGLTNDSIRTYYDNYNTVQGAGGFGYFDADQHADILVNGVIFSGLTGDTLADYSAFARNGASAGDLNGDGKFDIIVTDRNWQNTDGRVDIISGANGDTLHSWVGSSAGWFGHSVAAIDDMNGDGVNDIVVGEPKYDNVATDKGRITIYSGKTGSRLFRRVGSGSRDEFGYNISAAGDIDNDGSGDFLVAGAPTASSSLAVKAYSGSTNSLLYTKYGVKYQEEFGAAMDGIGDINQDGYDDFAISAYRFDWSFSSTRNKGNVYIYSGIDGALLQETYNSSTSPREKLGTAICGLGDTDGDGTPDFAVGAEWGQAPGDPSNEFRGAVYVYKCALTTAVADEVKSVLPVDFSLQQNYPNPFNPETVLGYTVPKKSQVVLEIYNLSGQKIRTLVNEIVPAGTYKVTWDGRNETAQKVASGVYLYKIQAESFTASRKMVLIK